MMGSDLGEDIVVGEMHDATRTRFRFDGHDPVVDRCSLHHDRYLAGFQVDVTPP